MKVQLRNLFSRKKGDRGNLKTPADVGSNLQSDIIKRDIGLDNRDLRESAAIGGTKGAKTESSSTERSKRTRKEDAIKSRNFLERLAYGILSSRLPKFTGYREEFEQSGIPIIYESYLSTGLLLGSIVSIPAFIVSLFLEIRFIPRASLPFSVLGSVILAGIVFAISLLLWLVYPLYRRRSFKSRLENQLAYSFGVMGALSAAGMFIDRLFESLSTSESNPVLADLSRRFLRNVRVFGLDSESALKEVAAHSPSKAFSTMLNSIAVALRTTGSIHDLVMFESSRLLQDKRDKLKKITGNLAVMAELYITLVVVGPIIFIVMMAIFGLLPAGGLPDPVIMIDLIVFLGIPALSVVMLILLDSTVGGTGS